MNKQQTVKKLFDVLHEIPTDVVLTLYRSKSVVEITPIGVGDFVERNDLSEMMEVLEILPNGHYLTENAEGDDTVVVAPEEVQIVFPEEVPDFDTMWNFNNPSLTNWVAQEGNLENVAWCGFRIYQHEKLGYLIGTNHDEPENLAKCFELLYDAMDLNWHLEDTYQLTQSTDTVASYFETKEVTMKALGEMSIHGLRSEIADLKIDHLYEIPYRLNEYVDQFPDLISRNDPFDKRFDGITIQVFKLGDLALHFSGQYPDDDVPVLSYDGMVTHYGIDQPEEGHYSEIENLAHFKELVMNELDKQLSIKKGIDLAEKIKSKEQQFDELVDHIKGEIKERPELFDLHHEDEKAMALAFKMADSEWENGLILINKKGRYLAYDSYEGFSLLDTRMDDALFKADIDKFGELFFSGLATAYSLNNQYQAVMDAGGQEAYDAKMKELADYENAMYDDHSDNRLQRDEDIRIADFSAKDEARDQQMQPLTLKERLSQIKSEEQGSSHLKPKQQKPQTIGR